VEEGRRGGGVEMNGCGNGDDGLFCKRRLTKGAFSCVYIEPFLFIQGGSYRMES
jgi:hypothetical protein